MRVLTICPGQDTGGQSIAIKRAFDRHAPGWSVRSVAATSNYIGYEADLPFQTATIQKHYDEADLVHFHNKLNGRAEWDRGQNKPTILHHHGTRLRTTAPQARAEGIKIGATELVSTIDLLPFAPGSEWLPSPHDGKYYESFRNPHRGRAIRIAHAPTDRNVKQTDELLRAMTSLSRSYDIELDLIEHKPWRVCLSRKGRADIFFDQLWLGYGQNAIEAYAMGIPVVAGARFLETKAKMLETWGELPFVDGGEDLEGTLARLIESKELRDEYGERGRAHFAKYHDEAQVVERLKRIWKGTVDGTAHRED